MTICVCGKASKVVCKRTTCFGERSKRVNETQSLFCSLINVTLNSYGGEFLKSKGKELEMGKHQEKGTFICLPDTKV